MAEPAGYTLDRNAVGRTREAVRFVEQHRQQFDEPPPPVPGGGRIARFRLTEPLAVGRSAAGRLLALERPAGGEYQWAQTQREELIQAAPGAYNHLPAGAEVTAHLTGAGWFTAMDELWGVLPGDIAPFPYMVMRIEGINILHPDAVQLHRPGTGVTSLYDDDYAFTTALVPEGSDTLPGESPKPRLTPCTPILPAKAAYKPFDQLLPNGEPIPDAILTAMGQGNHPAKGELWGPTIDAKLSRTISFLEIWWWELCPPDWQCVPGQVPNPDYDPDADVCDPLHGSYDPDNVACQPTIDGDVWGIVCDGEVITRAADSNGDNVPCTEDPPATPAPAIFRSPVGWWSLGGWSWNWFWSVGWWRNPAGWWDTSLLWQDAWWWGPFGATWWTSRWGGLPPTDDQLLELTADDVPTPPCGGGVLKRTRYGFIVWESGWRVLGSDPDNEVCTIVGPLKFRAPYLVVENPDPPESACGEAY